MTRNSKRAFTLVELIIVIAVIGVLAAILIPVFSNVVDKANIADKTSLARNLNSMIAADKEEVIDVSTMQEAMIIAHKQGYTDEQIFNTKTAGTIVFNTQTGNFAVATDVDDNGTATLAYADQGMTTAPAAALFTATEVTEIPAVGDQVFGMYLIDSTNSVAPYTVNSAVSVDVGNVNVSTLNFTYTGTEYREFTFRTNGGTFNVDAAAATVNHYGYSDLVNITAVDSIHSYHEFGAVAVIKIGMGHLVIEAGATVINGIAGLNGELDATKVKITLNAAAAVEGDHIAGLVDGSAKIEWTASVPTEVIGFAGGDGTQNNPYIIRTAQHMVNTAGMSADNYTYYKVADDVKVINMKDHCYAAKVYGSFDGNGCKFVGLDDALFARIGEYGNTTAYVVKNLSFDIDYTASYYWDGALASSSRGKVIVENVDAYGTFESGCATSYIGCAYSKNSNETVTFKDCTSYMTLIGTNGPASGFIGNPMTPNSTPVTHSFINCKFEGEMYTVGTQKCLYFIGHSNYKASCHVENATEINASKYNTVGSHDFEMGENLITYYNVASKTGHIKKLNINSVEKYEAITVDNISDSTHGAGAKAVAIMVIGPNIPGYGGVEGEAGNFTGPYIVEEISVDGGSYTTNRVRQYDISVNGDATTTTGISADGHTFNIVNPNYGHTYGSAGVTIKIYAADGALIGVYTYAFPVA